MSRLFVAVPLPDDVRAHLEDFLEPRTDADPDLRWSLPEQWHITLAFMPSVSTAAAERLEERLDAVATTTEPFDLALDGSGAFPDVASARVLFADVDDPLDALAPLARRVRGAANAAGARVDGTAFHPHVTLARRRPGDATRWLRVLDTYRSPVWTVDELVLVESHLGQGRGGHPRYADVATFPLR